jgi:8-oxo-dGTP pyrophosphatase MutT (NUDIX family)
MSPLLTAGEPALAPSSDLADVVALLRSRHLDGQQEQARSRMLGFAAGHPDALVRSCIDGHFTGSALVVDAAAERVLLLFHTKLQRWLQPGGHADGDGNLVGVALREASEETGIEGLRVDPDPIDLDIHVVESRHDPAHLHLDVRFLVLAPGDAVVSGNHESESLRWVAPHDTQGLDLDAGTLRLITAGLARARHRS